MLLSCPILSTKPQEYVQKIIQEIFQMAAVNRAKILYYQLDMHMKFPSLIISLPIKVVKILKESGKERCIFKSINPSGWHLQVPSPNFLFFL